MASDAGIVQERTGLSDEVTALINATDPPETTEKNEEGKGTDTGTEGTEGKEKTEGTEGKGTEEGSEGSEGTVDPKDLEIQELRAITREQKRQLEELTQNVQRTNEVIDKAGLISEEDKEKQAELEAAYAERAGHLQNLLAVMEVNPKYEDVNEVCSQSNLDDLVSMMTKAVVEEQGGDPRQIAYALTQRIWAQPNPYKWMYEKIKEYHPTYNKPTEKTEEKTTEKKEEVKGSKEDLVKVPLTAQDAGGAGGVTGGWTKEKIDNLPEDELNNVPSDIYAKYMRGELK